MIDATGHAPLIRRFASTNALHTIGIVLAGTVLLTLSAKVQVPFLPVPMTLQTFAVLFLGFTLGARLAGLTLLAYLAEGAVGLPVFAGTPEKGIGLAYMVGPTGGYLLGFFVAAVIAGLAGDRGWDRSVVKTALAGLAGLGAIYLFGLAWLGAVLGWDNPILNWGLWPFLPGEAFKLALLCLILPGIWHAINRQR